MHQWYLSYNGKQVGPFDQAAATAQAARDPNGFCWRQGFAEWIPIASCAELRAESSPGNMPVPERKMMHFRELVLTTNVKVLDESGKR